MDRYIGKRHMTYHLGKPEREVFAAPSWFAGLSTELAGSLRGLLLFVEVVVGVLEEVALPAVGDES